jgi:hypothetical protein
MNLTFLRDVSLFFETSFDTKKGRKKKEENKNGGSYIIIQTIFAGLPVIRLLRGLGSRGKGH